MSFPLKKIGYPVSSHHVDLDRKSFQDGLDRNQVFPKPRRVRIRQSYLVSVRSRCVHAGGGIKALSHTVEDFGLPICFTVTWASRLGTLPSFGFDKQSAGTGRTCGDDVNPFVTSVRLKVLHFPCVAKVA